MLKLNHISNETDKIYITGDEPLVIGDIILQQEVIGDYHEKKKIFVKKTNIDGLFWFGAENLGADIWGHPAGYVWSSRASVMNKLFDTKFIQIIYIDNNGRYSDCAMDLNVLEPLLKDTEYEINWTPQKEDKFDRIYEICKKN